MTSAPERASRWGPQERQREHDLLAEFARLPVDDPRRTAVRDELVTMHLPLVQHLARRYRDRGEALDDLVQVGTIGLIKAVDRFDPDRGVELATFATPTILGEVKRHFRDRTGSMRVPRRLQELGSQVSAATEALTRSLHRSPTVREIAEAIGVSTEDVLEALEARDARSAASLDADDASGATVAVGLDDPAFEAVEYRESLRPLLEALPERERQIILLRFFHGRSQSQIAEELAISQMHVSRLLARTLATLRDGLSSG